MSFIGIYKNFALIFIAEIADNEAIVERKSEELTNLNTDLENENSIWSSKDSAHSTLIGKYYDEIEIINQAILVLQQGGVVR